MEKTLDICPRCQQRFVRAPNSGDFVHKCFGSEVLANEDILVIGDWVDFSGSNNSVPANVTSAIQPNTLQAGRAGIEGDSFQPRTSRGFPKSRFRTRPHLEFIESKSFKHQFARRDRDPEEYD